MSCASYLGSGHRLEFYGEDGTLVLANPTADYMRGFSRSAMRAGPAKTLEPVAVEADPLDRAVSGRGADRAGVAARQPLSRRDRAAFADTPSFAEGYRAQVLLDAVRRSHALGRSHRHGLRGGGMTARILVTGGSGFIGSALVKALVRDGCRVRVFDDNSRGAPRRLTEVERDIEFVAGDIRDAAAVAGGGRAASTRCIISPTSTAPNSSTARPNSCSTSASRA